MDINNHVGDEGIVYHPIGVVKNAYLDKAHPKEVRNSKSFIQLDEKYIKTIDGLDRFSHLVIIYHLDRSNGFSELVHPMGDPSIPMRGVLATRSPRRPNPIGLTVVELVSIHGNCIEVTGLDALNGTPVLDIKPYEEHFDSPAGVMRERDPGYRPNEEI